MTKPPVDAVAAEVRAEIARRQPKTPQSEFAAELGMSQTQFSDRLSGDVEWRITEIIRLAELLGVPVTAFVPKSRIAATTAGAA
jgi:transcriptional regulator with XRE-family HTH domain